MKKTLFLIGFGACGFSLLAFLSSHFSGVWLGVEIIVLLVLFLVMSMTKTERLDDDPGSSAQEKPESSNPATPTPSTSPHWLVWGGMVTTVVIFLGFLLWNFAPQKLVSPAISKADLEMMSLGWQKIAVADVGGGYYSFEIPEGLTPGHKIKFQTVSWEMQRLSSGKEVDTCRGEWCTNYFFPAGVSVKDTPLYLKTKNPPRDFEWVKILPL